MMKPCCLEAKVVIGHEACDSIGRSLVGGSHGYREGDCPETAEAAAAVLGHTAHTMARETNAMESPAAQTQSQQVLSFDAGRLCVGLILGALAAGIWVIFRRPCRQDMTRPFLASEIE